MQGVPCAEGWPKELSLPHWVGQNYHFQANKDVGRMFSFVGGGQRKPVIFPQEEDGLQASWLGDEHPCPLVHTNVLLLLCARQRLAFVFSLQQVFTAFLLSAHHLLGAENTTVSKTDQP